METVKNVKAKQAKLPPFTTSNFQESVESMKWSITFSVCRKITCFCLGL